MLTYTLGSGGVGALYALQRFRFAARMLTYTLTYTLTHPRHALGSGGFAAQEQKTYADVC